MSTAALPADPLRKPWRMLAAGALAST